MRSWQLLKEQDDAASRLLSTSTRSSGMLLARCLRLNLYKQRSSTPPPPLYSRCMCGEGTVVSPKDKIAIEPYNEETKMIVATLPPM